MNFKELEDLFKSLLDEGFEDDPDDNKELKKHGIKLVHSSGGHEGGGEDVDRVYEKDGIFVRITGNYQSYSGIYWDEKVTQVTPQEKTITVYV